MHFLTFDDLFRAARDEALSRNPRLSREVIERPGTDANAMVAAGAGAADAVVGQLIQINAALFIDTAKGVALDKLLFDRYGLVRKPAAPARVPVEYRTRAPPGAGFPIPANTLLRSVDGKVFLTTQDVAYPSGTTGPVPGGVAQSVLAGLNQQVQPGAINAFAVVVPGAPPDLTVSNTFRSEGADDEESDEAFRDRGKRAYAAMRRATLGAIEAGALAVPGVRKAVAFEAIEADGTPARVVQLVVADAFTEQLVLSTVTPPSYGAHAGALRAAVNEALYDVRAAGIYVSVLVANVVLLGVTLSLRFRAGADADAAGFAARVAVANYVNGLKPGQTFSRTAAEDRLRTVPGLVVLGGEVVSPMGDVAATPFQVLRATLGFVTTGPGLVSAA